MTFPSPEVAWQAFRELTAQPFYGYQVLVEVARKLGDPYLATVTFREPAVETEFVDEADEDDDDGEDMSARRKRVKTNHDQPRWHVWRSAEAEHKDKEQRAAKENLHRSTRLKIPKEDVNKIGTPSPWSEELITYNIENLQNGVTASHLKAFLEKRNM